MAGLSDLKRKINSVKNTQKITKAMKMVSAAKMRRAQEAMENAGAYAHDIDELVNHIAGRVDAEMHPFLQKRETVENIALIVVTSDRGLCGAFNSNVMKEAIRFINLNSNKNLKLVLVGKKGNDLLGKKGYDVLLRKTDLAGTVVYDDAVQVSDLVIEQFLDEKIDEVHVIYNNFKSTALQIPVVKKILPLEFTAPTEAGADGSNMEYLYEPGPEMLLKEIMPRYVTFTIFNSLLESVAGEHGARMMAMDNASRNAKDMIGKLSLVYNKARQAAITNEILDIVNGAEALRG